MDSTGPGAIYVLATSPEGTRAALAGAREHAGKSRAELILIAPCVVPEREPVDHPTRSVAFMSAQHQALAEELGAAVRIRLCLCRSSATAISAMLPHRATVFLGGASRTLWPTSEQRLAARLSRSGRQVVFVAARNGTSQPPERAAAPALRSSEGRWQDRSNR
jgi:hypothetical protein